MKKFRNIFGIISILILLVSCNTEENNNNKPIEIEDSKALQEGKLKINSYSRSGDLIEELYQEIVDKTPALKEVEANFEALRLTQTDLQEKFKKYENKSNNYYSIANSKSTAISDSLLRKKVISLIMQSSKQYAGKTAELNSLLKQINDNDTNLNDHHNILKIVLTLPIIEKYQDDNKPGKKEFKNLIKEQENLLFQTDSLTPKY